jgi:hypothetical protein
MIVIGHVGGVPVEEMLPQLSAVGTALLLAATWVVSYVRRPRRARHDRPPRPVTAATDRGGASGSAVPE